MAVKPKPFKNIAPGFFIKEELEERGWTQSDLAEVLDISPKHLSQIINNKQAVTIGRARLLGEVFGQSPQYWLNLYTNYKLRLEETTESENTAAVKAEIFTHMPIAEMVKRRWIRPWNRDVNVLVGNVKKFWGIDKVEFSFMEEQLLPVFRKSAAVRFNQYFALCWYQMAKRCAKFYRVGRYDRRGLARLTRDFAAYSYHADGIQDFLKALNQVGVKFFVLPHLLKTYTDGAAFWDNGNPVAVWTGRYKREDSFWFTLAHEIAHIVLHLKDRDSFFIDCEKSESDEKENQANAFAASTIKRDEILTALGSGPITHSKVTKCSEELGISPAVIVGQLHHLGRLPQNHLRRLISNATGRIPTDYFVENKIGQ
jgi:HTH-type transcriptional regulator/antitoxin HigA